MAKKTIYCDHCKKPIKDQSELITATSFFQVKPFHLLCFERYVRHSAKGFFTYRQINGTTGNASFILTVILTLFIIFSGEYLIMQLLGALILAYMVTNRLISLFAYELPLKS